MATALLGAFFSCFLIFFSFSVSSVSFILFSLGWLGCKLGGSKREDVARWQQFMEHGYGAGNLKRRRREGERDGGGASRRSLVAGQVLNLSTGSSIR
jgi:hypothetical protein